MIKAIFLDLYFTLIYSDPWREIRQAEACRQCGLAVEPEAIRRAYVTAENFWTLANADRPIARRSLEERECFYAAYEQALLAAAGLEVEPDLALAVYQAYRQQPSQLRLYDDVLPTLDFLKGHDLTLGLISNIESDATPLCVNLGIGNHLDFVLSSCDVGFEKPDPRIFQRALELAGVPPAGAIHVGDQYHSDVAGARAAGIRPLLLDRAGLLADFDGVEKIADLGELRTILGDGSGVTGEPVEHGRGTSRPG